MKKVIQFVKDFPVPTILGVSILFLYIFFSKAGDGMFDGSALTLLIAGIGIMDYLYFRIIKPHYRKP